MTSYYIPDFMERAMEARRRMFREKRLKFNQNEKEIKEMSKYKITPKCNFIFHKNDMERRCVNCDFVINAPTEEIPLTDQVLYACHGNTDQIGCGVKIEIVG